MPIFGIDVSNYQAGIDLARARREGIDFVIGKVSQGSSYRSPAWPVQRDAARANGMLLAGYHFIDTSNPTTQAASCKAWIGDSGIPVALDWERGGGDWNNFLAVLAAFRGAGLNVRLGYIPGWYHSQQGSPDLTKTGLALWSSRYPSRTPAVPASGYRAVTGVTWSSYGGLSPQILQFTDCGQVAGLQVDCDAYLGSRDQLAALLGYSTTTAAVPPLHPREDDAMYIKCELNGPGKGVSTALLSGPIFVGLAGGELDSAEAAIKAGAVVQWVGAATWQELDRRSHALCDNPRPVKVVSDPPAASA